MAWLKTRERILKKKPKHKKKRCKRTNQTPKFKDSFSISITPLFIYIQKQRVKGGEEKKTQRQEFLIRYDNNDDEAFGSLTVNFLSSLKDFLNQIQTNMLFNDGGYNQTKRGRETNNNQLLLPMQSHQFPQVIDLSLLHNHNHPPPSNMVYTGLRLSSGEDQTQKSSDWFHHQNLVSNSSENVFTAHINKQSEELDAFLHVQEEELRRTLAEKRKMHYKAFLGTVEESFVRKLREKEAEIERATHRYNELEARDAQLRAEAQAWQVRAKEQEAAAASLQAQLQQAVNKCAQDSRVEEEGLLCTAAGISGLDDAESAYVDPERVRWRSCKGCRKREATVVVLPCRHLSICPGCDRTALACPLCLTLRNSSVEAILC